MGYTGEQKRAYQREWVARRRVAWFAEHGPCSRCGSDDALELHHIDPSTKISHSIWSWSQERRDAEAAKCVVLCHQCHAEESAEFCRTPLVHGTHNGYGRGCRCGECRRGQREYNRRHRAMVRARATQMIGAS